MEARLKTFTFLFTFIMAWSWLSPSTTALEAFNARNNVAVALIGLQPKLAPKQAVKLAKAFVSVSNEASCGIDWRILASIAFNESSLDQTKVNARTKDHGLMQINIKTIKRLGLDAARVMRDTEYAVRAACQVLRHNKDRYHKRTYWLGIYRSGTAFSDPRIVDNAKRYQKLILKTAKQIGYT